MDDRRFDFWTRRRFGLAAVGLGVALPGLIGPGAADARKRKKRRNRCRKLLQICHPGGKKRCCKGLRCDEAKLPRDGYSCCRNYQAICESESECCNSLRCLSAVGLEGTRCCSAFGFPCFEDSDCCLGVPNVFCNDTNMCSGSL